MDALAGAAAAAAPVAADLRLEGVDKSFGAKAVLRNVSLRVPAGRIVTLLGPSGCGKTTLLRIVAGLEVPDAGTVQVGDRTLTDGPRATAPERRRVGMVFQDWALFPHMTVAANVGYGLPRAERKGRGVVDALALVGLEGLGDRMPGTLSGGQQQRVALARALAPQPALLLFDEPFSNLDASLRVRVRADVHRLLRELGITALFVTHDQEEAFVLGDEVAVLHDGVLVQQAPPAEIYTRPATPWVAGFVGDANLVLARVHDGAAVTPLGPVPLAAPPPDPTAGTVVVLVRPEHVAVAVGLGIAVGAGPGGDATVDTVEQYGHDAVIAVLVGDAPPLRARLPGITALRPGDAVTVRYAGPAARAWPG